MTTPAQPEAPAATSAAADTARRSPALLLAAAAGLCWAGALGLLLSASVGPAQPPLSQPRVVFYALALTAALLTFIPIERQLRVPGLALEGVAGAALLLYTLAFVPPPTGWLLSPPDAPVYVVLAAGLFWFVSAVAIWPVYAAGTRLFRQRARQYDLRRARRQAHEAGAIAALTVGLAGMRVLTPVGVLLLVLIVFVVELLFLSFVETES